MSKKLSVIIILLVSSILSAGCGGSKAKDQGGGTLSGDLDPAAVIGTAPLTLSIYSYALGFSDADFKTFFADPVQKKFPNVTLQYLQPTTGNDPESLIAAGSFPDIVFTPDLNTFKSLGMLEDLNNLIKKYNVNLNNFDPTVIAAIKSIGDQGQMYALPFSAQRAGLFYNKDLFDKFGVPYPQDGLIWDQAIEIGKKLTRSDGGVQYSGLHAEPVHTLSVQLSLPYVDNATNKATLDTPSWKTVLETVQSMYAYDPNKLLGFGNRDAFLKDQTLAMIPDWVNDMLGAMGKVFTNGKTFNWGVAQHPSFKEAPNTSRADGGQHLVISSTSQHKEQAFSLITYLISPEVQTTVSKNGRIPALIDPGVEKNFATQLKFIQGENFAGVFKGKIAKFNPATKLDGPVTKIIDNAGNDVLQGKDVNTAIRDSQEAANLAIQKVLLGQ